MSDDTFNADGAGDHADNHASDAAPTEEQKLDAAVRIFKLAHAPAAAFLAGRDDALDYDPLTFGQYYVVTQPIASNRGDALVVGQKVYFLGADCRSDTDLALHFETKQGERLCLWFDGDAPQTADTRRYFRDIDTVLRPVALDLSKRRKNLTAAKAVLLHLRTDEGLT